MNSIMEEISEESDACDVKRSLGDSHYWESNKIVCGIIISQSKDRFSFSDYLIAAQLFECEKFKHYRTSFPTE